jgi:hypothetical protein
VPYQIRRRDKLPFVHDQRLDLDEIKAAIHDRWDHDGGPGQVRLPDEDWSADYLGRVELTDEVVRRAHALVPKAVRFRLNAKSTDKDGRPDGPVYLVRRVPALTIGPAESTPAWPGYPMDNWSPPMQRVVRVAYGIDHDLRCNGGAYTRPVNPPDWWHPGMGLPAGSTWSQHARFKALACRGNAADLVFYTAGGDVDMTQLDRHAARMVAIARAGELPELGRLIIRDHSYRKSTGYAAESYGGVYHYHEHTESVYQSGPVCS